MPQTPYENSQPKRATGFNIFSFGDDITFNRLGKTVYARGRDNTHVSSETVEANLLYEILRVLKKK